jgi:uncharacterized membrane-anchored protein
MYKFSSITFPMFQVQLLSSILMLTEISHVTGTSQASGHAVYEREIMAYFFASKPGPTSFTLAKIMNTPPY